MKFLRIIFYKQSLLMLALFSGFNTWAQKDWIVAFPITDYILKENGGTIVQVRFSEALQIEEKQVGILVKSYSNDKENKERITTKCYLVKGGEYAYFAFKDAEKKFEPQKGDLMYVVMPKPLWSNLDLVKISAHKIDFKDVEDVPITVAINVLSLWGETEEKKAIQKMVQDIQRVGKYYLNEEGNMPNSEVKEGPYKGKKIFNIMEKCTTEDIKHFLSYIMVRPRIYAGQTWRISEVFATWVDSGAPIPIEK